MKATIHSRINAPSGMIANSATQFGMPLRGKMRQNGITSSAAKQDQPDQAAAHAIVAVHHFAASFFSSPGRMYSAPSQGDMKSNWRYSCTSFTGS